MINKKASTGGISVGLVFAIFLGIVLLIFLSGGGISTILKITSVIKQIPGWGWVILLIIFIFKRWGKK